MDRSAIEWTDATWNPVTGCDRVSSGCDNCYALTLANRLKLMGSPKYQRDGNSITSGPGFDVTIHPGALATPMAWKRPRRIFVNSMSDLFHARVPTAFIDQVFNVMRQTPQHQYQVLTKRALRIKRLAQKIDWPSNLWLGVSVEDMATMSRIDSLRTVPLTTRFVSCEPLLESLQGVDLSGIDWLIVGGESGPRARSMDVEWVRQLRDEAVREDVAFFFKQWGGRTPKANGRMLDGRFWNEYPLRGEMDG